MYKSEVEINKDVKTMIDTALAFYEVPDFTVLLQKQPINFKVKNPTILFNRVNTKPIGYQFAKDKILDGELKTVESRLVDITYQITGIKKRPDITTASEITSGDAIQKIWLFFNSRSGLALAKKLGYGIIKCKEILEPSFIDSSNFYERSPKIDLVLNRVQAIASNQNHITQFNNGTIKGV